MVSRSISRSVIRLVKFDLSFIVKWRQCLIKIVVGHQFKQWYIFFRDCLRTLFLKTIKHNIYEIVQCTFPPLNSIHNSILFNKFVEFVGMETEKGSIQVVTNAHSMAAIILRNIPKDNTHVCYGFDKKP